MLKEILSEQKIYNFYKNNLISRSIASSVVLDVDSKTEGDFESTIKHVYLDKAFDFLFNESEITRFRDVYWLLPQLIKCLTGGEYSGYRKVSAIVTGSNVERTSPIHIRNKLLELFDQYEYELEAKNLDIFEREAKFHITLLRIHPFGDGNGRLARLLTTYNFINANIAPPILTPDRKKEYCEYIENDDYMGMANLMKELSKTEEKIIEQTFEYIKTHHDSKTR